MSTVADRVRKARERGGYKSQTALARALGVKPQTIQSIESGRSRHSRLLPLIAARTGFNYLWLVTGEGPEIVAMREAPNPYGDLTAEAVRVARAWMLLKPGQAKLLFLLISQLAQDAAAHIA